MGGTDMGKEETPPIEAYEDEKPQWPKREPSKAGLDELFLKGEPGAKRVIAGRDRKRDELLELIALKDLADKVGTEEDKAREKKKVIDFMKKHGIKELELPLDK